MARISGFEPTEFADTDTGAAVALVSPFAAPLTEPLALIAKGGVTTGYFSFAYKGADPHVALLTTNTFDPFERLMDSIGVEREDVGSRSFEAAEKRLKTWLDEGCPTAVWLDLWSLPYLGYATPDPHMYGSFPALVYGYEGEEYLIAGRSQVGLKLSRSELERAWGRLKKDRYRMVRVTEFHPDKLAPGLVSSLKVCVDLFFDGPKPGVPAANFGIRAYDTWAGLLTSDKGPQSWAKVFPPGRPLACGLATAFGGPFGLGLTGVSPGDGRRGAFAQGLRDLGRLDAGKAWADAAAAFDRAGETWRSLGDALLPKNDAALPLLAALRRNLESREREYRSRGGAAAGDLIRLRREYEELLAAEQARPLLVGEVAGVLQHRVADQLRLVKQADESAFRTLEELLA